MTTKAEAPGVASFLARAAEGELEAESDFLRQEPGNLPTDATWHRAAVGEPGSDLASFLFFTGDGRAFRVSVERSEDDDTDPAEDYAGP